jgi:hypothetical protein
MPQARNTIKQFSRAFREQNSEKNPIIYLPAAGCTLAIPRIPMAVRASWDKQQKARWKELWQSPQATQWDDSVSATVALLITYESQLLAGNGSAWVAQEARYASDALGLTPKAMNALGWRIAGINQKEEES